MPNPCLFISKLNFFQSRHTSSTILSHRIQVSTTTMLTWFASQPHSNWLATRNAKLRLVRKLNLKVEMIKLHTFTVMNAHCCVKTWYTALLTIYLQHEPQQNQQMVDICNTIQSILCTPPQSDFHCVRVGQRMRVKPHKFAITSWNA